MPAWLERNGTFRHAAMADRRTTARSSLGHSAEQTTRRKLTISPQRAPVVPTHARAPGRRYQGVGATRDGDLEPAGRRRYHAAEPASSKLQKSAANKADAELLPCMTLTRRALQTYSSRSAATVPARFRQGIGAARSDSRKIPTTDRAAPSMPTRMRRRRGTVGRAVSQSSSRKAECR